jgi:hypothetical protein
MRTLFHAVLGVVAFGASCALPSPAEAGPPAQLAQARYVALGYDLGDGFVSETDVRADVLPEERAALQTIRAGIEQWGRYQIVVRPGQAELLIAVRKGRLATIGGGIHVGGPSSGRAGGGPVGIGPMGGVQVSSPDDMIEVFEASSGSLIWRGMKPNGLSGAGPPLWDNFRAEVAKAEKSVPKKP